MSPLLGFSDNPFRSRDDVLQAATALLTALTPYKSACGARIKVATATGTGFDEIAAQLEGYARPLWVVADLLAIQSTTTGDTSKIDRLDLDSWVRGLGVGVDPRSNTFWGHVGNHDQRMVEMEPIAYALLTAPSVFLPISSDAPDSDPQVNQQRRDMIVAWLRSINDRNVPPSNWRWFRILANLALVISCGVPYSEIKPLMDEDFKVLDSFYIMDGWSSDGLWSTYKKQADYYSGSFAIQYSQLLYVRFAHDLDPERVGRYRSEAGKFAETFWRYFDINGAAIPFGRSLTYRFAFAAFWSAVAVADIALPPPLNHPGIVKGLLLRHLRWWAKQNGIFNTDGTLTIGYTYPNMYMSEDYNSPQSPYWCLKTFSVLALDKDHQFWSCKELPHPLSDGESFLSPARRSPSTLATINQQFINLGPIVVVHPAVQIICSSREHHFLLSAGQFTRKPHRAREAKYGKLAYSSAFAFSVPTATLLTQMAPDSTLSISNDDGESWKARWEPIASRIQRLKLSLKASEKNELETMVTPALISGWRPWRAFDLQIETILIPPLERWPGWHVRIHKLTWQNQQLDTSFRIVDAGFAISGEGFKGGPLPQFNSELKVRYDSKPERVHDIIKEGIWEAGSTCLIVSEAGASGIFGFPNKCQEKCPIQVTHISRGYLLRPEANTNLIAQRSLIPTLYHQFNFDSSLDVVNQESCGNTSEVWFVAGVFAVAASARLDPAVITKFWQDKPCLSIQEYMDIL
ncbi:hypothetical protein BP5796_09336 [Coleophoma crateriformis]|uniref:DUF2264 domain-containing protein n=1 Tax=Coleophoma crateriformis TaxID=565419 RepID=A0A3D8R3U4_9HELO|nr:hypothetical protein BP5796_09336 [Coleophoma crateriformis]